MPDTKTVMHAGFDHPITINATDFDPEVHSEIDERAKPKATKKGAKAD